MSSQIPAAIDKLVALFTAALPADVTVADGPQTAWPTERWAVVGGDGPVQEEEDAARGTQTWKGLGAKVRDEAIDIICAVGASSGDVGSMKPLRDSAYGLLTLIETQLCADYGLGGFTTGGAAAVVDSALKYVTNSQGAAAVVVFTINIPVRSGI